MNKSEKKDPTDSYIEYLNSNILNRIDYGRLADQHALLEASPGKHFRGGEAAHADEAVSYTHLSRS